ncbi:MAG TPA: ankyrin repeat domain-containing protein, partial [Desulfatiglandales bacterium]|nr:ankyrin repeat domain-containing protein [Desulfatiglandales bacterium]
SQMLIKYGADVNAVDVSGRTPLYYAVSSGSEDLVKVLIAKNANVDIADDDGWTVSHLAIMNYKKSNNMLELLLSYNVDINAKDVDGKTPLHWACFMRRSQAAYALLNNKKKQVDINARDKDERTPLHLAAKENLTEIVRLLLSHNANKNIKDRRGKTPLALAESRRYKETVQLLRE